MTDKEMLELAAKAIGVKAMYGRACEGIEGRLLHPKGGGLLCMNNLYWNPLADDGDALRLVVACRLTVCTDGSTTVSAHEAHRHDDGVFVTQSIDRCESKQAATRRAITRAAAEIGKSMQ